ncbi:hypothetical protein M758_2G009400 [Ceratodon purpureus]|nr:hypothetical protein M758_2G009400 [Ceratodon purpureus]
MAWEQWHGNNGRRKPREPREHYSGTWEQSVGVRNGQCALRNAQCGGHRVMYVNLCLSITSLILCCVVLRSALLCSALLCSALLYSACAVAFRPLALLRFLGGVGHCSHRCVFKPHRRCCALG